MIETVHKDNACIVVFENTTEKEQKMLDNVLNYVEESKKEPPKQMDIKELLTDKPAPANNDNPEEAKDAETKSETDVPVKKKMVFRFRRDMKKTEQSVPEQTASEQPAEQPAARSPEQAKASGEQAKAPGFTRRKPKGFVYRRDEKALAAEFEGEAKAVNGTINGGAETKASESEKQADRLEGAMPIPEKASQPADEMLAENNISGARSSGDGIESGREEAGETDNSAKKERKKLNFKGKLNFVGKNDGGEGLAEAERNKKLSAILQFLRENYLDNPFLSHEQKAKVAREKFHYDMEKGVFEKGMDPASIDLKAIMDGGASDVSFEDCMNPPVKEDTTEDMADDFGER
jgi:hypothetical protein